MYHGNGRFPPPGYPPFSPPDHPPPAPQHPLGVQANSMPIVPPGNAQLYSPPPPTGYASSTPHLSHPPEPRRKGLVGVLVSGLKRLDEAATNIVNESRANYEAQQARLAQQATQANALPDFPQPSGMQAAFGPYAGPVQGPSVPPSVAPPAVPTSQGMSVPATEPQANARPDFPQPSGMQAAFGPYAGPVQAPSVPPSVAPPAVPTSHGMSVPATEPQVGSREWMMLECRKADQLVAEYQALLASGVSPQSPEAQALKARADAQSAVAIQYVAYMRQWAMQANAMPLFPTMSSLSSQLHASTMAGIDSLNAGGSWKSGSYFGNTGTYYSNRPGDWTYLS